MTATHDTPTDPAPPSNRATSLSEEQRIFLVAAAGAKALGIEVATDVARRAAVLLTEDGPWSVEAVIAKLVRARAHASLSVAERYRVVEQMATAWESNR